MPGILLGAVDTEIKKIQFVLTPEILAFQWGSETNISFQNSVINSKTEVCARSSDATEQERSYLFGGGE